MNTSLDVYGLYQKKVKKLEEDKEKHENGFKKFEKSTRLNPRILKGQSGYLGSVHVFQVCKNFLDDNKANLEKPKFVDNDKAQRQSIANHIRRIQQ